MLRQLYVVKTKRRGPVQSLQARCLLLSCAPTKLEVLHCEQLHGMAQVASFCTGALDARKLSQFFALVPPKQLLWHLNPLCYQHHGTCFLLQVHHVTRQIEYHGELMSLTEAIVGFPVGGQVLISGSTYQRIYGRLHTIGPLHPITVTQGRSMLGRSRSRRLSSQPKEAWKGVSQSSQSTLHQWWHVAAAMHSMCWQSATAVSISRHTSLRIVNGNTMGGVSVRTLLSNGSVTKQWQCQCAQFTEQLL